MYSQTQSWEQKGNEIGLTNTDIDSIRRAAFNEYLFEQEYKAAFKAEGIKKSWNFNPHSLMYDQTQSWEQKGTELGLTNSHIDSIRRAAFDEYLFELEYKEAFREKGTHVDMEEKGKTLGFTQNDFERWKLEAHEAGK